MQGSLSLSYGLGDVVRGVYGGRHSGILSVRGGTRIVQLFFEMGNFVFSDSNDSTWRLGDLLVRRGQLQPEELERVLALLAPGKRIGHVLRDLGFLTDAQVQEAVAHQITEKVYDAFSWVEGDYEFEQREEPAPSDVAVAMSTANVIMEGIRRIRDEEFVRRAIGPGEQQVRLGSNPLLRFQEIHLKPEEGFILSRIDGSLTVDEVSAISPVPEERVLRCLYGLKCTGILEIRPTAEEYATAEDATIASFFTDYAGAEQFLGTRTVERGAESELSADEEREQAEIVALAGRLEQLDCYQLLGVEAGADVATIRKAYYRLAKQYHPDRHHRTHLTRLQDKLERIFVHINEAYETLRDGDSRASYDRSRSNGPARAGTPAAAASSSPPAAEPADDAAHRAKLAEASYREGRQLYERGDYFGAVRAFQIAVRTQPDRAPYQSWLGRALGRNPKWRKEAEEHLLKAIELEPSVGDHYSHLGILYESAGLQTRADRYFDEALKWDPANAAAREARERRAGDQGKTSSSGARPRR